MLLRSVLLLHFSEDVCVLSASGTAAIIGFHYSETGDILSNIQTKAQTVNKDNTVIDTEKDKPPTKPSEPVSTVRYICRMYFFQVMSLSLILFCHS